ncbi:Uncharacterised protein [Lysinibacillus sphaericus]|nr:Uncharacterised protein [Lysinibacillus sphaericus]
MHVYDEKDLPWYLRDTPFFIISFLFVPISLIILIVKRKQIYRETMSDRLFIAGMFTFLFMLKFLPSNVYTIIIAVLLYLFTGFLLVMKLIITDKSNK